MAGFRSKAAVFGDAPVTRRALRCIRMTSAARNAFPFRTKRRTALVHHNNRRCPVGNMIDRVDRAIGTGGLPLCGLCATFGPRDSDASDDAGA
jgi:hypothetical protein